MPTAKNMRLENSALCSSCMLPSLFQPSDAQDNSYNNIHTGNYVGLNCMYAESCAVQCNLCWNEAL